MNASELVSRTKKAAEVLQIKNLRKEVEEGLFQTITQVLEKIGIDDSEIGLKILEAETTTFEVFKENFMLILGQRVPTIIRTNERVDFPIPRLQAAWQYLKGKDPFKKEEMNLKPADKDIYTTLQTSLQVLKPIGQWGDFELIAEYGRNCPDAITQELFQRSKGRPTILFKDDGSVDVEESLFMLRKARIQETPQMFKNKKVFVIGEFPADILHECPIHSNILLVDGYCEECGKDWDVNDTEKNQFIRLVSVFEKIDFRLYSVRTKSFEELKTDFPKINLKFYELKEEGKLPVLKSRPSKTRSGDPFHFVERHKTF